MHRVLWRRANECSSRRDMAGRQGIEPQASLCSNITEFPSPPPPPSPPPLLAAPLFMLDVYSSLYGPHHSPPVAPAVSGSGLPPQDYLQGDASKAKAKLGWEPKVTFHVRYILCQLPLCVGVGRWVGVGGCLCGWVGVRALVCVFVWVWCGWVGVGGCLWV